MADKRKPIPRLADDFDLSELSLPVTPSAAGSTAVVTVHEPLVVSIDLLVEDPDNARRMFLDETIREMASSIALNGVLEPLLVVKLDDGRYGVRGGARRLRGARLAGLTQVPVLVKQELDPVQAILLNVAREDLDAFDLGHALARLVASNLSGADLAKRLGKSPDWVSRLIALDRLPDSIRTHLRSIQITDVRAMSELSRLYRKYPEAVEAAVLQATAVTRSSVAALALGLESPAAQVPVPTPGPTAASVVPAHDEPKTGALRPGATSVPPAARTDASPESPEQVARLLIEHNGARFVLRPELIDRAAGTIVAASLADGSIVRLPLPVTVVAFE